MKREAIKKVTEILQKFCDDNMLDVEVRHGRRFYCRFDKQYVAWENCPDASDRWFKQHVFEQHDAKFPKKYFDWFTISLLHEIGHLKTERLISEETWNEYAYKVEYIENKTSCKKKSQMIYWNLEPEFKATDWAVSWLNNDNNRNAILELRKELSPYIEI